MSTTVPTRFAALRAPWYKGYLAGSSLGMTGDHVEHAVTYYVMWELFHSPALAGFAVIAHWLPHLLFGVFFGGLADRYDCRRIVQVGQGLFMLASLGWAIVIFTHSVQPWICVVLLLVHGLASAIWGPSEQMMIYDIVGPDDLPSGVRLSATGFNLGMFVGPLVGAALLFSVGPVAALLINLALYVPFIVYLWIVPYDGHERRGLASRTRLTIRAAFHLLSEIPKFPPILAVFILQGAVGLLIGTAVIPLLPDFGQQLGQAGSGVGYAFLITAMSMGAVIAGVGMEAIGRIRAGSRLAIGSTVVFASALLVFALSHNLVVSVIVLVFAGAGNLISASTSQAVVQINAPDDRRGSFLGAFSMVGTGLRVGSGVIIGILGSVLGAAGAIAIDSALLLLVAGALFIVVVRRGRPDARSVDVIPDVAELDRARHPQDSPSLLIDTV